MSLIQCKECGKRISKNAVSCPYCGEPVPRKKGTPWFIWVVVVVFGLVFIGQIQEEKDDLKKPEKEVVCKEFAYLHDYDKWSLELGKSKRDMIDSGFKVKVWEQRTSDGKGGVRGELPPGSRVLISTEGLDDYMVEDDRIKMSFGWINKLQIKKTRYENPITGMPCTPK